ncbi:MAG: HAMP domain-containing sensor histidine kinase [Elusimicrobiales bacterium]|jgi:signal transduction histidine kinase
MIRFLNRLFFGTPRRALSSGLFLFCALSALDYLLADEVSIDVFYFIPIFIVTWRGGRAWGVGMSLAGTLAWLGDARVFAPAFTDATWIVFWNAAVRLGSMLALVQLLTELKGLLARERAVSGLKSSMLHTVSHEFNNSLTSMSAGLFLLQETEPSGGDETRPRIYAMLNDAQRAMALYVKNILNEARMEAGKFRLEKKPVALRDLALEATGTAREILRQKGIKLSVKMPEQPIMVDADQAALALVISNLLGNAIKYTPQNGRITVEICPSGEPPSKVIFSVEDTGIGISLEDLKHITAGFYRTQEGKNAADGFGLGLKISNELLNLHGSRLEIASEKGKGSSFFFELPALQGGSDKPPHEQRSADFAD